MPPMAGSPAPGQPAPSGADSAQVGHAPGDLHERAKGGDREHGQERVKPKSRRRYGQCEQDADRDQSVVAAAAWRDIPSLAAVAGRWDVQIHWISPSELCQKAFNADTHRLAITMPILRRRFPIIFIYKYLWAATAGRTVIAGTDQLVRREALVAAGTNSGLSKGGTKFVGCLPMEA